MSAIADTLVQGRQERAACEEQDEVFAYLEEEQHGWVVDLLRT